MWTQGSGSPLTPKAAPWGVPRWMGWVDPGVLVSPHPPRLQFGGLGQLADGVLGLDDFLRSRERRLWPGYDYVGWHRPPGPRPHVELEFEFEGLRAFRAMQVLRGVTPQG